MLWMLPLKRYFQFSGRSGRAEYWHFVGVLVAAHIAVLILEGLTASNDGSGAASLTLLLGLATIIPAYAVTFRRLHDRNHSGWLVGILFMLNGIYFTVERVRSTIESAVLAAPFALVGWITILATMAIAVYVLVQVCQAGDAGPNRFGAPPYIADAADEAALRTSLNAAGERVRTATAPQPTSDPVEQLERLSKLHAAGALTDAEFNEQKAALLGRL